MILDKCQRADSYSKELVEYCEVLRHKIVSYFFGWQHRWLTDSSSSGIHEKKNVFDGRDRIYTFEISTAELQQYNLEVDFNSIYLYKIQ